MSDVTLDVNGETHTLDVDSSTPLLYVLRNDLGLRGPRFGCGLSQCGACTVLIDGAAVRSCLMLAVQAGGKTIETVESLATDETLSPLQAAFHRNFALQCGFCTPGMILTAKSLLDQNPHPNEEEIRAYMIGNICRCTGYRKIVEAILDAADKSGI